MIRRMCIVMFLLIIPPVSNAEPMIDYYSPAAYPCHIHRHPVRYRVVHRHRCIPVRMPCVCEDLFDFDYDRRTGDDVTSELQIN